MLNVHSPTNGCLGFLLLRDGHAVPLAGISPEEIKDGARERVPHPDAEPLKHRRTLDAIIDRLGYRGDFGDFTRTGWPDFQEYLRKNGCTRRSGLFPSDHGGCIDLFFQATSGPTAARDGVEELLEQDLHEICDDHKRKHSFINRLRRAGLID